MDRWATVARSVDTIGIRAGARGRVIFLIWNDWLRIVFTIETVDDHIVADLVVRELRRSVVLVRTIKRHCRMLSLDNQREIAGNDIS